MIRGDVKYHFSDDTIFDFQMPFVKMLSADQKINRSIFGMFEEPSMMYVKFYLKFYF